VLVAVAGGAAVWHAPPLAQAQSGDTLVAVDGYELALDASVRPLSFPPGGVVRISGRVVDGATGAVIDADTESGRGQRSEAGLIDPVASGLALVERHPDSNTYAYNAGDLSGARCADAGLAAPCLILRLPQLAAARGRDVDELREDLTGALRVDVLAPAAPFVAAPPAPTWVVPPSVPPVMVYEPPPPRDGGGPWLAATVAGGGIVLSVAFLVLALRRRRRPGGRDPVARVRAAAVRLRKRLRGDTVKARLLGVVDELAAEAEALVKQQERLAQAVRDGKPEELERRKAELEEMARQLAEHGGEEAGQGEMLGAARIVQSQIDRIRKWEMQRWRSAARLERVATRLEALEAELDDPAAAAAGPNQELLDLLQEELDLARAGEREAEKLLGNPRAEDSRAA
jgi:hypothetical protein